MKTCKLNIRNRTTDKKLPILFLQTDGNIHCHSSSLGIGDRGKVPVIGPPLNTERRKRGRDGVDYERIFSSVSLVLCAHMSLLRILVARLKAILPLHEHCIGAGESNVSTYKIKHAKLPITPNAWLFHKIKY
jgi:hypothetical protein